MSDAIRKLSRAGAKEIIFVIEARTPTEIRGTHVQLQLRGFGVDVKDSTAALERVAIDGNLGMTANFLCKSVTVESVEPYIVDG